MDTKYFGEIDNKKMLASFLKTDEVSLINYLNTEGVIYDENDQQPITKPIELAIHSLNVYKNDYRYSRMRIPKKSGKGFRVVYKVEDEALKNIHKTIQYYLNEAYLPIDCVHGFVHNRNVKTNASKHLAKKKILRIDVKDFFPSISEKHVKAAFNKMGFKQHISEYLTKLTTLNNELVQGFNTSPILANIVAEPLDIQLWELCKKLDCVYSRYADDFYISSDNDLPDSSKIEAIFNTFNFKINCTKTKIMYRGQKQYVTGLTVFDNKNPRIPKQMKNRIRFSLHYLVKYGFFSCVQKGGENNYVILSKKHLKGWIDYVNSIEPVLAAHYMGKFNRINWDTMKHDEIKKK